MQVTLDTNSEQDRNDIKRLFGFAEYADLESQRMRIYDLEQKVAELEKTKSVAPPSRSGITVADRIMQEINKAEILTMVELQSRIVDYKEMTISSIVYKMVADGRLRKSSSRPIKFFAGKINPEIEECIAPGTKISILG